MSSSFSQESLFHATVPYVSPADVDLFALSDPARVFTGDFYFAHREGDRLTVALGDVAGKGLDAALFMAVIQEELENSLASCSRVGTDPARAMERIHAVLRPLMPRNKFASAIVANLYDDGRLVVANAGHLPLLIARRDGTIGEVGSTGPVLGLLSGPQWRSTATVVRRGESIVLYTDGVVEAPDADGKEFGAERLARMIEAAVRCGAADARSLASDIAAAARQHSNGLRADDLTVLVARRPNSDGDFGS